jgi:hypothetical protein
VLPSQQRINAASGSGNRDAIATARHSGFARSTEGLRHDDHTPAPTIKDDALIDEQINCDGIELAQMAVMRRG